MILFASNQPIEQKLAAYRYLMNKMHSIPLNTEDKTKNGTPFYTLLRPVDFPVH